MNREFTRGLYIHLPFCLKKCDYCDFVSYTDAYDKEKAYKTALLSEFSRYRGEKIDTVYLGGGTPTSLKTETLTDILDGVFQNFDVDKNAEVTIECNPKTADKEKFCALRESGVNRLSIGVQSLDDAVLREIGRIHSAKDATFCVESAKNAGFSNISADLMFGLPGQSMESLTKSIDGLLAMPLSHISCYGLILEENTPLAKRVKEEKAQLPDEDTEYEMYCRIKQKLEKAGFARYEISNFAKGGAVSRHNVRYWTCGEYIGCGAGAHSYFCGERYSHPSDICRYLREPNLREDVLHVGRDDAMGEFMMLGLRMTDGVSENEFLHRFGVFLDARYGEIIKKYEKLGTVARKDGRVFLTDEGIYISNTVLCEFV